MRSFVLAAFAALAALAPSSAFITAAPRAAAPRAAATGQRYPHASLSQAGSSVRVASSPLRMMSGADTAVEQKGLVTVYHKDGCPHCKNVSVWQQQQSLSMFSDEEMQPACFGRVTSCVDVAGRRRTAVSADVDVCRTVCVISDIVAYLPWRSHTQLPCRALRESIAWFSRLSRRSPVKWTSESIGIASCCTVNHTR